jgi:hypothetical protein
MSAEHDVELEELYGAHNYEPLDVVRERARASGCGTYVERVRREAAWIASAR